MPFTYELKTAQRLRVYRKDETTAHAKRLTELLNQDTNAYNKMVDELTAKGIVLGSSGKTAFELCEEPDAAVGVAIKFQVKGSVITWSFNSPKDITYQEDRDILYKTAANAHDHVKRGCEKYYRGTNAYHLKTMHTADIEYLYNHNHYRIEGGSVTPQDVKEHLEGFKLQPHAKHFFPDLREIDKLIEMYAEYWKGWTAKAKSEDESLQEQYEREASQKLDEDDIEEQEQGLPQQNPCRVSKDNLSADALEKAQLERLRGIASNQAHARETGSKANQNSAQLGVSNSKDALFADKSKSSQHGHGLASAARSTGTKSK